MVDLSLSFIAQGDREVQDVAVNPGLIAVLCIFGIVMAVVVVVVIVKAVRSRRPHFERLDDVSMVSLKCSGSVQTPKFPYYSAFSSGYEFLAAHGKMFITVLNTL